MVIALIMYMNQVPDEENKKLAIQQLESRLDEIAFNLKCGHNLNKAHIRKEVRLVEDPKAQFNRIVFTLDDPLEDKIDFPEVAEIAQDQFAPVMDRSLEVKLDRKKILQPLVA